MFQIDQYAYQNRWKDVSVIHKFLIYLTCLVVSFSGISFLQILLILCVGLFTCYVAKITLRKYLKWYLHASIFIGISLLTFVVSYGYQETNFLFSFPLGQGYLGVNKESSFLSLFLLLRIYAGLVSTYFFILTVPFVQMLELFKKLRFPTFLLELIILMYRFIFLVMYEFMTIRDTLDLKFSFYNKKKAYQAWGRLANTLFLKLLDDNERLNEVLMLKFDGSYGER